MNEKNRKRELSSHQEAQISKEFKNITFTVVLVRPEHAANIGSIARIMENFNFEDLVIFNPKESVEKIKSYNAQGFAMHGKDILLDSKIIEIQDQDNHESEFRNFLKNYDYIIATTAKGKSSSNIRRLSIFPEELKLPFTIESLHVALLFGKESRGLTNEEISHADVILRIPTGSTYPSLNLSHACGIILYEIFKKINIIKIGRGKNPVLLAEQEDRLILMDIVSQLIHKLKIRSHKKDNVFYAFKNIFGRSFMSKKELSLMLGLFSKVNKILEDLNLYGT